MSALEERFWAKVEKTEGCWNWKAGKNVNGYGRIAVLKDGKYRALLAHRVAYEISVGTIPEGLGLDHKCHNRGCVRPTHLRPVTAKENLENLVGAFSTSKSGVRGVSWAHKLNKWRAAVTHNKRQFSAGYFESIEEAAVAVKALRNSLFTHNDTDKAA